MAFKLLLLFIACLCTISLLEAIPSSCNTVMTSSTGNFSSPGYPGNYKDSLNCSYTIKMPQDKRIALTVHGYSIEANYDYLDIVEAGKQIARLTGNRFTDVHFVSSKNQIDALFTTDKENSDTGFNASYYSFPASAPYVIAADTLTAGQKLAIYVLDFAPKPRNSSFRDLACGFMPRRTGYTMTKFAVYNPMLRKLEAVSPMSTAFIGRVNITGNLSLTVSPVRVSDINGTFLCKLTYTNGSYLREVESKILRVPDSCKNYKVFSDPNRAISYTTNTSLPCDNSLLTNWYRFIGQAGDRMLDYCPSDDGVRFRCGIDGMGWLNGRYPRVEDAVVTRQFCVASYAAGRNGCCVFQKNIQVRNCGEYFVYFLTPITWCPSRYCGNYGGNIMQASSTPAKVIPTTPSLDGCKYYQVLSDQNRLNTYSGGSNTRCDNNLNGWYRFMSDAGNRMASTCPGINGRSENYCGAFWQGWLNTSHPNEYDEEVYRTVCFSRSFNCTCEDQKYIKVKNCGHYFVYKLEGVPKCNQRYCGAKDNMTSVSCGSNYMRIDLDMRYYNASRYSSITLRDPTCPATTSSAYITLGSIPYLCGGEREQTADKIIYRNKVIMTANQNSDSITRDHDVEIAFKCVFNRDGFADGVSFEPVRKISGNETGIGRFSFKFAMYTSQSYANQHYSYPAKVKLRDWLYFQATANVQDSSLVLLIDQCYSTPNMDRKHYNKYMFINNGCPIDKTVRFHNVDGQKQRFSMQAFRYLGNTMKVFVHCLVFLCHNSSLDNRCHSGCPGNSVSRVRRDLEGAPPFASGDSSHSQYYLLEAGPVVLDKEDRSSNKGSQGKGSQGNALLAVAIALVAVVVALAVIVAVLFMKMKHPKSSTKNVKEEIGIDHAPNGRQYVNEDEAVDRKEVKEERL